MKNSELSWRDQQRLIQRDRRKQIQKVCQRQGQQLKDVSEDLVQEFMVLKKRELAYCRHGKVSSKDKKNQKPLNIVLRHALVFFSFWCITWIIPILSAKHICIPKANLSQPVVPLSRQKQRLSEGLK